MGEKWKAGMLERKCSSHGSVPEGALQYFFSLSREIFYFNFGLIWVDILDSYLHSDIFFSFGKQ